MEVSVLHPVEVVSGEFWVQATRSLSHPPRFLSSSLSTAFPVFPQSLSVAGSAGAIIWGNK